MREIVATTRIIVPLGRQGENEATVVKFPVGGWETLYGAGAFELLNVRPSENTPYTCSITVDDDFVYWVVQAADVALVGHGKCELTYVVDGTVAKSLTFETCVLDSIEGAGTVPPPYESRIHDLIEASANITEEADRAETAATRAEDAAQLAEGDKDIATQAATDATNAADAASGSASDAEAWAVGKRGGVDVPTDDETFHNNAEFYAEMAQQVAVNNGFATFYLDDDGVLYLARTANIVDNLDFRLTADGELEALIYG